MNTFEIQTNSNQLPKKAKNSNPPILAAKENVGKMKETTKKLNLIFPNLLTYYN
jgi:hypothetical protein